MLVGFGFQFVDELGHHVVVQWTRLVDIVPLVEASDKLMAADGDLVWSGVGDRDPAHVVVVEFDQRRTAL